MPRSCVFRWPTRSALHAAVLGTLGVLSVPALAQQQTPSDRVDFNAEFLSIGGNQPHADLSLFSTGNRVFAGTYLVDVSLNERSTGQTDIRFAAVEGKVNASPCLTRGMLGAWGVNVRVFPSLATLADDACVDLVSTIPESAATYDGSKQRLTLSIPQAALKRSARGAVGPEKWDKGITAAMLDYQLNFARYSGSSTRNATQFPAPQQNIFDGNPFVDNTRKPQRNTLFAGLRTGFNIGDWRLRHFSTYNRGLDGRSRWQGVSTYAQRDLASMNAYLRIGDGNTPGNFFDSLPFRGVQMASDDAMLPDSQQGYAPTIRGVAQTNARVTVRQNGYIIHSTYVAPGPFVIDDLYPTSSSGDLEVSIAEADGRQMRYMQAFSAVPTLLRDGTWRFSAAVGKYRLGEGAETSPTEPSMTRPAFVQATLARGLGNELSLYGGLMAANMYQSLLVGAGKNLRNFGAVSVDLAHAWTTDRTPLNGTSVYSGQSLRFLYSKSFLDTGTSFRVAGYRYSTSGYRTFQEAVQMQDLPPMESFHSRRNELRFELSQQLGDRGSVYASARQQSYWGTSAQDRLVQIGYSGNHKQLGYSIFYNHSTSLNRAPNRQIMVTLTIPFGDTHAHAQYAATRDHGGRIVQQASVYGAALDDSRLTYNLTAAHANQDGDGNTSASASYLSPVGRFDLGHSRGPGYGQTTVGVAGGLLAHADGVTLSQPLGETVALVQAPKAQGVGLESRSGVRTDWAGNAVIPNLSPYRLNRVALRTGDLGDTVEVKNAAMDVVPTRGAVVAARFETSVGYRLLITLTNGKGRALPLGARIENESGQEVGVVGPDGQAFVTGAADSGRLTVRWGQETADQCEAPYDLPVESSPPPIRELAAQCQATDGAPPKEAK
ncbi:fimbria/pilus outer membrane usher protein [Variovorax paradoxus]|uniref:Fimbria/pilus outer membrane usher protein n=1 Tax=Variovorax paradoxus TaxID=34073 RepID=A0A5Q0LXF1_VARPD|nr:fimbria/pilus outer membrane usher protein [Variovorax paradoxus]QFZ81849.1 fimbria/pilus outer membrane usher protein [Variovorax paradoxus]